MFWLLRVKGKRLTGLRIAEATAAGTDIPSYHESGCPPTPTFSHIGTSPTTADGVQAMRLYNPFCLGVAFIGSYANLQPLGLSGSLFWFHIVIDVAWLLEVCFSSLQLAVEEVSQASVEVHSGVSSINAMITVSVELHLEGFVELHQMLGIFGTLLEVDVIIGHAMNQQ